jgi:hypothetical protein
MTDWYLMSQPILKGEFEREEFDDYAQDGFDEILTETQLGKEIVLCGGEFDGVNFENEFQTTGIIQSETPDTYTQGWKRQLLTRITDSVSDYKYIKYDDKIWLIMNEPTDNCIYDKCVIHQCNYILKWQDKNKKIIYCPATIENASQYNAGLEGNKTVMVGYNQLMVFVSLDNNTKVIPRGLRVFIDYNTEAPIPYEVTRPDTVTYSYGKDRVMCMIMTEHQYNPVTDSIEELLCDYIETDNSDDTENIVPIEFTYTGESVVKIGRSKTFTVENSSYVTFSLAVPSIFTDKITLEQTSDISCKVKAENDSVLVGSSFKIIATDTDNKQAELLVEIGGI